MSLSHHIIFTLGMMICTASIPAKPITGVNSEESLQFIPLQGQQRGQYTSDPSYVRDLETYYQRREYPGSPPYIPHSITNMDAERNETCQSCHGKGGYVKAFAAYAPVTPHPERVSCRQCHVQKSTTNLFKQHQWHPMATYSIKRTAISGGPPGIPHQLFGRGACLSCHGGPSAIREVKTSHPERVHCRQCHVSLLGD